MNEPKFVSRGGLKLYHALHTFHLDIRGNSAVDLGCSTGGFTDCLLQAGASKVFSVDTAYGQLAWTLRNDPRVVVCERRNGLHFAPPEQVDIAVADMGWTPQRLLIPSAMKWLKAEGSIISLIKPHYEANDSPVWKERLKGLPRGGVLDSATSLAIAEEVVARLPELGVTVQGMIESPILGGQHKGKGTGNVEYLAWLKAVPRNQAVPGALPPVL